MSIYIGEPIVVSDMQGPCPDGFHVPSLQDIYNNGTGLLAVWNGLGLSNTDVKTYFKLPDAGSIYYNDGIAYGRGTNGSYWTSTNSTGTQAIRLYAKNTSADFKCMGYPIRGFKNTPVEPDSSWTVLYQGTGTAGVYHNPQLGLITASSDGTTWYTIMDKNLGATTVYNYGDTLTDDNCGYYYQRGNNYGFSYTGTRTTSSTIVDASSYGPGNYYSSSTFIINSTNGFWDRPTNNNLRGGVSQGTSTKSVEVQNIYIGEYKWKPGSNTLAYYKFDGNLNDSSGNSRNLSLYSGSVTYGTTSGGAKYGYFNTNTRTNNITYSSLNYGSSKYTISYWINPRQKFTSPSYKISVEMTSTDHSKIFIRTFNTIGVNQGGDSYIYDAQYNNWYQVVIVRDGATLTKYINGSLVNVGTNEFSSGTYDVYFRLNNAENQNNTTYSNDQYFSEFIVESTARTADQVLSYYNQTKSNYGL